MISHLLRDSFGAWCLTFAFLFRGLYLSVDAISNLAFHPFTKFLLNLLQFLFQLIKDLSEHLSLVFKLWFPGILKHLGLFPLLRREFSHLYSGFLLPRVLWVPARAPYSIEIILRCWPAFYAVSNIQDCWLVLLYYLGQAALETRTYG